MGRANLFAFGIGSSVNRHLIEGMARAGMGEPFVITTPEQAPEKAAAFRKLIASPVLTGIKVDFGRFEAFDVEPPGIPDILADRPVIVFGKWRGRPRGIIRVQGLAGDRIFSEKVDVSEIKPLQTNSALGYLWARHRIALLSDYNTLNPQDERVKEITRLGLTYNLLTAYTSFIAIDTRVRLEDGHAVTVKQPLPLPRGVSDYAVGESRSLAKKSVSCFTAALPASGSQYQVQPQHLERKKQKSETGELECDALSRTPNIIEPVEIRVTGDLPEKSIRTVLQKHLASLDACWRQALGKQPDLKKTIVFTLIIDSSGRVTEVKPGKGCGEKSAVERCMIRELKNLNFPATAPGKKSMVRIRFVVK
jgi:Ca-activated chloride channel family protein